MAPGCFAFLSKTKAKASEPVREKAALPPPPEPQLQPHLPAAHEHFEPCFQCSGASAWDKLDAELPAYTARAPFSSDARAAIVAAINDAAPALTKLSLYISDHPELGYHEVHAHKHLTAFLEDAGFAVERGYKGLATAFRASYKHGSGGRVFAFNSEYDALPGIGHACGHNLIAVSGVAAALGVRAGMRKAGLSGEVVLIGTPAEEGGVGKGVLIERGGYKGVDACMMIHPVGGMGAAPGRGAVTPTLAINTVNVEFFGRTAHAGGAPWDGVNALDAANIAYTSISALRQQIHTTERVHGIILRGGDAPNIIPDYTAMKFYVRAQSAAGVEALIARVCACFDGAALATGCKVKYTTERVMMDLRNNLPLAEEYAAAMGEEFHLPTYVGIDDWSVAGGSTDFGNVTYEMPAAHPHYGVASPEGGNHTVAFRNACRTDEAHDYTWKFAAGMACVAARFMQDKAFADDVKSWYGKHTKGKK
ncbi:amidohydrolase [Cutaneotrichosporon oleaginosum]|uniref:Amidohydrolase n=1 Tax=Cutaneotrichosporon oleaginosum TaxID=879819 RepID=A0A0J0XNH2_9TREE|nr:amidohydrolase [Cutaneotrichosporon oleaginosum]KLT42680.1 amidohydrolase [Cutaneotrichosporon oleaginosum]TXT09599.1 hypothetical protein COLE_03533 [Cutaneotrichosporon oleaginosum]